MRAVRWTAAAVALLMAGSAARAAGDQDRLVELDEITISHELCNFPLSDEQAAAVANESDAIIEALDLGPDAVQRLYNQYAEILRRQKASGLCAPDGRWAKTYAALVAALPKGTP